MVVDGQVFVGLRFRSIRCCGAAASASWGLSMRPKAVYIASHSLIYEQFDSSDVGG